MQLCKFTYSHGLVRFLFMCVTFVCTDRILAKIKIERLTVIDFDICHRKLYRVDLDILFKDKIFHVNTSGTVRASTKMYSMAFMDVEFRHRMVPL